MVQNKKKFSSGNKKPIGQELEKKSQSTASSMEKASEASRAGNMKQSTAAKPGMNKKDVGSRK